MKSMPRVATSLCAVALGMLLIVCSKLPWQPQGAMYRTKMVLPAATQSSLGSDIRGAVAVLSNATTEDDATQVDSWLQRLNSASLPVALKQVLAHPAPLLRQRWLAVVFKRWAMQNREQALNTALALESASLRAVALNTVLDQWNDLGTEWRWAMSLSDAATQTHVLKHLLQQHTASAPVLVASMAAGLADPFQRRMALDEVSKAWSQSDPVACLNWAKLQSDPATRRAIIGAPLLALSQQHPQQAFEAADAEPDLAARQSLVAMVLRAMAFHHRSDALAMLGSGALTEDMQPGLRALGETLAEGEVPTSMIERIPAGALRDAFLAGVVSRLRATGRTSLATALANKMGQGIEREEALR